MNLENMKIVRDLIKRIPDRNFDMATTIRGSFSELREFKCGTAGCIAGWAIAISFRGEDYWGPESGDWNGADEFLGLTPIQADNLFLGYWRRPLTDPLELDEITREMAVEHLTKIIDHYEKTGRCKIKF